MRPPLPVGIQNSVAADDLVVLIFKERKIIISRKFVLQYLNESLGVFVTVDAYREYLCLLLFLFA